MSERVVRCGKAITLKCPSVIKQFCMSFGCCYLCSGFPALGPVLFVVFLSGWLFSFLNNSFFSGGWKGLQRYNKPSPWSKL